MSDFRAGMSPALADLCVLRVEADALERRRAEVAGARDRAIVLARAGGASWTELIDASGVSRAVVQRALKSSAGATG